MKTEKHKIDNCKQGCLEENDDHQNEPTNRKTACFAACFSVLAVNKITASTAFAFVSIADSVSGQGRHVCCVRLAGVKYTPLGHRLKRSVVDSCE